MYDFIHLDIGNIKIPKDFDIYTPSYNRYSSNPLYEVYHYNNLKLFKSKGGNVSLKGSFHKFHNNGEHNKDDFSLIDFVETIEKINSVLNVDLWKRQIHSVEYGFNLIPQNIEVNSLLDSMALHKEKKFSRYKDLPRRYSIELKRQRFTIKFYNKSIQKPIHNNKNELIRTEIRFSRMMDLNKSGIFKLVDLIEKKNISLLQEFMLNKIKECLLIDPTIDTHRLNTTLKDKMRDWKNHDYWCNLTRKKRHCERKEFYKIIDSDSLKVQSNLLKQLQTKFTDFTATLPAGTY